MVDVIVRRTVRVLLIDSQESVLLFASVKDSGRRFWFPPGGGIEPGETPDQTARRELREETGLADIDLLGLIGRRRMTHAWLGSIYEFQEQWFLARVPPFDIDTSNHTEMEISSIVAHRWWHPAEISESSELFVPGDLAGLVSRILAEGLPSEPIVLGP
jgi:8-oxo-dGTP pyrophosphatase MutT (NUDIX family)